MAFINYGCLYKVNGTLQNSNNPLFSETPTWVPEIAYDSEGSEYRIRDNFFAYLGDYNFFLCFYKWYWLAVSGNKVLHKGPTHFLSETNIINDIEVKTEHIDKTYRVCKLWYPSYDKRSKDNTYSKEDFFTLKDYYRYIKYVHRHPYKVLSDRYRTRFTYNGISYDVLFGYGIDTKEAMNSLLDEYEFTKDELNMINNGCEE